MRTISYGFPLIDLVHELTFTHAQLDANPLTVPLTKPFADLAADAKKAVLRQLDLVAAYAVSEARKVQADSVLNDLVDKTRATLLGLTKNSRDTPLYKRLFGDQAASSIKRPILGRQLELMRDWLGPLSTATPPELVALATPLAAAIKVADDAVATGRSAEQQLTDFLEVGDCKALVDKVNALRKGTHGKLAELVHDRPEAHLPADFAEQFFVRESRWTAPDRETLVSRIARSDKQSAQLRQLLKEYDEQRARDDQSEREAQADALRTKLAAAAKRRADEQAREAAIQAQLDRITSPSAPPV